MCDDDIYGNINHISALTLSKKLEILLGSPYDILIIDQLNWKIESRIHREPVSSARHWLCIYPTLSIRFDVKSASNRGSLLSG